MTNQSKPYEPLSQAQKALKIFMVPKFTGAAYFAATEKGAKEAVTELKGKGVAIDFLYTGPSVANTDEWFVSQGPSHWWGQRSLMWWPNRPGRAHASPS